MTADIQLMYWPKLNAHAKQAREDLDLREDVPSAEEAAAAMGEVRTLARELQQRRSVENLYYARTSHVKRFVLYGGSPFTLDVPGAPLSSAETLRRLLAEVLRNDPFVDRVEVVDVLQLSAGQLRDYCRSLRGR